MSDSNRTILSYVEEATLGTTPSTPTFQTLRYTGESLSFDVATTASNEMRSDRNVSDLIRNDFSAGGGFDIELSADSFDDLLESAMFGAFASNVLKNGTTRKSFTIERGHLDINQFFQYKGMVVDTLSLNVAAGSIITGNFGFVGMSSTRSTATAASTLDAATTTDVMNAMSNVADIKEGGSTMSGVYINKLSLSVKNNLRGQKAIGNTGSVSVNSGTFEVEGSIDVYFANGDLYDKFLNGTATSLEFTTSTSSTSGYTWKLPNIKFSSDKINAGGLNSDVMETLGFKGLYSASDACTLMITKLTT